MKYKHLSESERTMLSRLRQQGMAIPAIASLLQRSPSTLYRELARNSCRDGRYRVEKAESRARGRSHLSGKNLRLTEDMMTYIHAHLQRYWSPEQIVQRARRDGIPMICHESLYRLIEEDRIAGGTWHRYLRCHRKQRRKRYRSYDRRGILTGKRMITERPAAVQSRQTIGHWEGDTMVGPGKDCLLTLVERKTGFTIIGKLLDRTKDSVNAVAYQLLKSYRHVVKTITFDNGSEFHGYKELESSLQTTIYFALPHHSWERGTNENTNGLIRQFCPKRLTLRFLTQHTCHNIAKILNDRPRKRLAFRTPHEAFTEELKFAL